MALSKLSDDVQGMILDQLRNALEPRLVMYYSSANKELRALLTPGVQQQLRADYEEATALCLKMGWNCKKLREATEIHWHAHWCFIDSCNKGLSAADLATLAKLGSVLPALETVTLLLHSDSADGVQQLAEGLVAGSLPALTFLFIGDIQGAMGDAGASALAAALDRGALPRLQLLALENAAIGAAGLAALAPALRRLPALESLYLGGNPFGGEGIAALVAPPPQAGAPPPTTEGLAKLKVLSLWNTQITDAGCATLASALNSGALPALKRLPLQRIPASQPATAAVYAARANLSSSVW